MGPFPFVCYHCKKASRQKIAGTSHIYYQKFGHDVGIWQPLFSSRHADATCCFQGVGVLAHQTISHQKSKINLCNLRLHWCNNMISQQTMWLSWSPCWTLNLTNQCDRVVSMLNSTYKKSGTGKTVVDWISCWTQYTKTWNQLLHSTCLWEHRSRGLWQRYRVLKTYSSASFYRWGKTLNIWFQLVKVFPSGGFTAKYVT